MFIFVYTFIYKIIISPIVIKSTPRDVFTYDIRVLQQYNKKCLCPIL